MAVEETFIPPSSSNIAQFTYDPQTENLTVEFVGGSVYTYYSVGITLVRRWQQDGGSGAFFHRNIRSRFTYDKE